MLGHEDVNQAEEAWNWKGGPFIITYTGKVFPFDCITPDCIDIHDIAHALSHLCRFTGHTKSFYSVAQHSLLVSEKMPGRPAEKLAGLLHDAAEAYTNDLASPLKKWMNNESGGHTPYLDLQDSITAMIYNKYGVTSIPSDVRLYDQAAGLFEAEGFMNLSLEQLKGYSFSVELRELWEPWKPHDFAHRNGDLKCSVIRALFLKRFESLMDQLGRTNNG